MSKMNLRKWYGTSVAVPNYGSKSFANFAASCIGLVNSILDKKMGRKVHVRFIAEGTAAADVDGGIIYMNQEFVGGYFRDGKQERSDTTIECILGLIVHEAAHFAYSPSTLEHAGEYVRQHCTAPFNVVIAKYLFNTIEDIYIEAEIDRVVPSISWMLETLNHTMFPADETLQTLRKASSISEPPSDVNQVAPLLNLLILAKMYAEMGEVNEYLQRLFILARSATELSRLQDRYALTTTLYDAIMQSVLNGEDKSGKNGESIEITSEQAETLDASSRSARGLTSALGRKIKPLNATQPDVKRLEEMTERLHEAEITISPKRYARGITELTCTIEFPLEIGSPSLLMDKKYQALSAVARQRAVVNRPYGMDMNRGHSIRKLYRIATDQKIFAQSLAMNNYKPMQVVILIDCSSSMHAGVGSVIPESRLKASARAALGAAYGLVEGRCEVAVYGHTSDVIGGGELLVYKAKSFQEPVDLLDGRLAQLMQEGHSQNRDGFAILQMGRKFTSDKKRRVLIVISDGAPEAPGYHGEPAMEHTKQCIEDLRAKRIAVLSISISDSARRTNDRLYGEKWNVFNEDPNVIEEVVRVLINE